MAEKVEHDQSKSGREALRTKTEVWLPQVLLFRQVSVANVRDVGRVTGLK